MFLNRQPPVTSIGVTSIVSGMPRRNTSEPETKTRSPSSENRQAPTPTIEAAPRQADLGAAAEDDAARGVEHGVETVRGREAHAADQAVALDVDALRAGAGNEGQRKAQARVRRVIRVRMVRGPRC